MLYCVHVYKDAMLGRFYAICNCCCGAMEAQRNGTPMLASSGYVAVVDADLCAACGSCADVCQFAAISKDDGFARVDAGPCYLEHPPSHRIVNRSALRYNSPRVTNRRALASAQAPA